MKNSNTLEMRREFERHVLDRMKIDNLLGTVENVRHECRTDYRCGVKLVEGGCFLAAYADIEEYFREIGYLLPGERKSNNWLWDKYTHVMALAVERILHKHEKEAAA